MRSSSELKKKLDVLVGEVRNDPSISKYYLYENEVISNMQILLNHFEKYGTFENYPIDNNHLTLLGKMQRMKVLDWFGFGDDPLGKGYSKGENYSIAYRMGMKKYIRKKRTEVNGGSKFKRFIKDNEIIIGFVVTVILAMLGWIIP